MFETQRGQTMKNSIICPNKNDPAWKTLVQAIGEDRSYLAFFRNGDVIPDVVTARALLFGKSPTLPAPKPETKPAAAPSPAPKLAPEQTLALSAAKRPAAAPPAAPKAGVRITCRVVARSKMRAQFRRPRSNRATTRGEAPF